MKVISLHLPCSLVTVLTNDWCIILILCIVFAFFSFKIFSLVRKDFLARLHEVQKSYCSHPGRTRSRSRSRSTLR